ncbi:slipin family protein [Hoeflea prorocentri]|uniref:Slipin family protein n=2 Tax=Hoeflea prorocentri TaxID=1922333 RepID=A0A9X3UEJ2_9HYPH|nr:slipin family protein [Hoeflea prorocentri]MCY6379255.1 slipin family protein [Hoeflea prorocentri]MDA5397056.1 slipin family protein [Hoeflea prorocentri]
MKTIGRMIGFDRVLIRENERAVALHKGRFMGILVPGEYWLRNARGTLQIEVHDLNDPEFVSSFDDALFRVMPDVASEHLTEIRTGSMEVAVILRDGRFFSVLPPDGRTVVWTQTGPWSVERFDVSETIEVPRDAAKMLRRATKHARVVQAEITQNQTGLLYVDGEFVRTYGPGAHLFWDVGRKVDMRLIDTRWQSVDVSGQEVLTKDRVTIRLNVAADYRVVDPVKAVASVQDFYETLYRALQYAFRKALGAKTLDQILENKVTVDDEVANKVKSHMAEIGVQVGEIALKDVILPGEMREILNQVVAATKEAEANVIRRREETNATRSLLNTAKVMAENPVMLRLKELEALEQIAGKVERLTVHSGTNGLMNDLVSLRD